MTQQSTPLLSSSDAQNKGCHQDDWTGRVVVRFLSNNADKDYEIKNKPKARVDVSEISEMGQAIQQNVAQSHPNDESGNDEELLHSNQIPNNPEDCTIRIDVSLTSRVTGQPIAINLIRDGAEDASNCLKRLELSLIKKLSKKKSKGKKQKVVAQASTSSCVVLLEDKDESKPAQEINPQSMSNHQLWNLCTTSSISLRLKIGEDSAILPVECNPPTIYKVTAFEDFDCDIFPHVPLVLRVETLFSTRAVVDWYANGERVCQDSTCYVPTIDDVSKSLAVIITPVRPGHTSHLYTEAYRYKRKVASALPPNTTLDIRKAWLSRPKDSNNLRVMSYNILADQNAFTGPEQQPFFPYVPKELLLRSRRFPLILQEILEHKADVICLQEVDSFVFSSLLQPALEFYNYQGFHSLKQSSGNNEGCAIFWSLDQFQEVRTEDIKTFRISELLKECLEGNDGMNASWKECTAPILQLFAKRKDLEDIVLSNLGHVLQVVRLKDREGKVILVANTHLFFHPMGSHIRALQMFAVAHQLSIERGSEEIPYLLIGDLNSSLGNAATLILKKRIPSNYRDYKESLNNFSWDGHHGTAGHSDDFPALSIPESFPTLLNGYSKSPEFTHYIVGFKATIDHIFMSEQSGTSTLRPLYHAPMPNVEEVTRNTAMPSVNFPSDHISLVCDLEWAPI
ncbi:unnamed protein product [Cylindrotheca closterium]|uniref:Endonuclease/exonuclease/phosphatase domain-containing protein n=1 Tax=Cylindrotheca closterium TaxID=2856 RepID=A0AAD2CBP7_9STRA|nr:unnamed protein product [Cylindrotheca closterium]